ncbi:hypothetical protein SHO565_47940 [Streptomyces sp. HO565]
MPRTVTTAYRPARVSVHSSGSDSTHAVAVAARQRVRRPTRAGTAAMASPAPALITPMAAYTSPAWSPCPSRSVNAVIPAWQAPNIAPWRAREA